MPWKTFLKAHWSVIAAADFFTVEVLTAGGLVRYFVMFVIELKTRRIHIAGINAQPERAWMAPGDMVLRWLAVSLIEASKSFRKLRGYAGMPKLVAALRAHDVKVTPRVVDVKRKAA